MRKILLFIFGFVAVAHGQVSNPPPMIFVGIAPSGSCQEGSSAQLMITTGVIYTCQSGTWAAVSGGGGGSLPSGNIGTVPTYATTGTTATPTPFAASMEYDTTNNYIESSGGANFNYGYLAFGDSESTDNTVIAGAPSYPGLLSQITGTNVIDNAITGNTASDITRNMFSKLAPALWGSPVVTMASGTNDAANYGVAGQTSGGTGTQLGYLRFYDSALTWATMTPWDKHVTALQASVAVVKVVDNANTITLLLNATTPAPAYFSEGLSLTLSGFTTNTGLNGKTFHVAQRLDNVTTPGTSLILFEPCASGCSTATETGTMAIGWWTNSGFTFDASFGAPTPSGFNGTIVATPGLVATASGASLTGVTAPGSIPADGTTSDAAWIGPCGCYLVWYYSYNVGFGGTTNGTGTFGNFQVSINGVNQTDTYTNSSTITTKSGPDYGANNGSTAITPLVALARFNGLTPSTFANVVINVTQANTGLGQVGIIAAGSPSQNSFHGVGSPSIYAGGNPFVNGETPTSPPATNPGPTYNLWALQEATQLSLPVSQGGLGLSIYPVNERTYSNGDFDFYGPPSLASSGLHPAQSARYGWMRAFSNAMKIQTPYGLGALNILNGGSTSITPNCNQNVLQDTAVIPIIMPNCPQGTLMFLINPSATASVTVTYPSNAGDAPTVLFPGQSIPIVTATNASGNWFFVAGGWDNYYVVNTAGASGTTTIVNSRFSLYTSTGANISFTGNTAPSGTRITLANLNASASITVSGTAGGDVPAVLNSLSSETLYTTGSNVWYVTGSYNNTLTAVTPSIGGSLVSAGCTAFSTVTVTGANTTQTCNMSGAGGNQPANIQPNCYISAANTVTPQLCTAVSAGVTPTAQTYNLKVF